MAVNCGEKTTLTWNSSAVAHVTNISGPNSKVKAIETTDLDSTFKTFRPSKNPEAGTLDFELLVQSGNAATWQTLLTTPATATVKVTFEDGANLTATAFPTDFKYGGMTNEDNVKLSVTLQLSGAVTYSAS